MFEMWVAKHLSKSHDKRQLQCIVEDHIQIDLHKISGRM